MYALRAIYVVAAEPRMPEDPGGQLAKMESPLYVPLGGLIGGIPQKSAIY